jgi:peptide-methionine (S)-S-oxide reductase
MGDHTEAFQLDYDPSRISYAELLELFWAAHNPARESYSIQYMAAAFTEGDEQLRLALESRARIAERIGRAVKTRVAPLTRFYRAEDYHQKYLLRRRDDFVKEFASYGPQAFTDSTVAARLNGYLGGKGSPAQLEAELSSFGLSPTARERLQTVVRSSSR